MEKQLEKQEGTINEHNRSLKSQKEKTEKLDSEIKEVKQNLVSAKEEVKNPIETNMRSFKKELTEDIKKGEEVSEVRAKALDLKLEEHQDKLLKDLTKAIAPSRSPQS